MKTPDEWGAWFTAHVQPLEVPLGAVLAVLCAVLVMRGVRSHGLARVGRVVVMPVVLAWEAQGLHELVLASQIHGKGSWIFAGVTAGVLICFAAAADEHYEKHATLGWPGRFVWIVGPSMGIAVAFTATNPGEFILRLLLPLLVSLLWWSKFAPPILTDVDRATTRRRGSWKWTPRRIGVELGLLEPTDLDIEEVNYERRVQQLTAALHRYHEGWSLLRGHRSQRLQRLGRTATESMLEEAQRRIDRINRIKAMTAPGWTPDLDALPNTIDDEPSPTIADTAPTAELTAIDMADIARLQAPAPIQSIPDKGTEGGHDRFSGQVQLTTHRAGAPASQPLPVTVPLPRRDELTDSGELNLSGLGMREKRELAERWAPPALAMVKDGLAAGRTITGQMVRNWVEDQTRSDGFAWLPSQGWAKGIVRTAKDEMGLTADTSDVEEVDDTEALVGASR